MRIAYLILAHENIEQLATLIDIQTKNTENYCFVHLDGRLNRSSNIRKIALNVKSRRWEVIKAKRPISWGGFSMIEATIDLILAALNKGVQFDFLSLHSGLDFPLKSNKEISGVLEANKKKQFLEYFSLPYAHWTGNGGIDRFRYYWFHEELGLIKAIELMNAQKSAKMTKAYPKGIAHIYGGPQWWTLTSAYAEYIIHYLNDHPEINHFFKYCHIPDELFFQTILRNSKNQDYIENCNLRLIDWESGPDYP